VQARGVFAHRKEDSPEANNPDATYVQDYRRCRWRAWQTASRSHWVRKALFI